MSEEMTISTKDRPGSYDAIETAKPGEPLFPIQGGDPFGPPTVLHWAELARAAGMAEADEKKSERLLRKASDAEQVAWAMRAYQRGEEEQDGQRARYNDAPLTVDETSDHARAVREARIKSASRLNNLIAGATEVSELLAKLDACPAEVRALDDAIGTIRTIAEHVEPRRGNERS